MRTEYSAGIPRCPSSRCLSSGAKWFQALRDTRPACKAHSPGPGTRQTGGCCSSACGRPPACVVWEVSAASDPVEPAAECSPHGEAGMSGPQQQLRKLSAAPRCTGGSRGLPGLLRSLRPSLLTPAGSGVSLGPLATATATPK